MCLCVCSRCIAPMMLSKKIGGARPSTLALVPIFDDYFVTDLSFAFAHLTWFYIPNIDFNSAHVLTGNVPTSDQIPKILRGDFS
ncbi:MAG: hypothetical protein COT74_01755 [Bdellovibrionales bacterium CG10_big_fil_rev_8_21_14_0_10_45_34]|nr:MAG: hypothetical protein COT74_01755 [Bdellovibrionales bacterium CG10_big_fil_rev_8_21_14_0_10_45_34]